jgi:hypothetical protein
MESYSGIPNDITPSDIVSCTLIVIATILILYAIFRYSERKRQSELSKKLVADREAHQTEEWLDSQW